MTEPDPAATDSTWVSASREVRSTAKWLITALAAVAAVVFGAGPVITKPSLDVTTDFYQIAVAFVLGLLGLLGIGLLVFSVSKVLLPTEMSLDDLPTELLDKVAAAPMSFLPGDEPTIGSFRATLASLRRAIVDIPREIRDYETKAREARRGGDTAAYAEAQKGVAAFEVAYRDTQINLAKYEAVRADLIDRGAYTKISRVFSEQTWLLWWGAVLAGVGGLGFQLALSSVPDSGASTADSAGGIAIVSPRDAATDFWTSHGLADCETSTGQVPTLVTGGEGTSDSPYRVQTIPDRTGPGSACPAISFTALPELFDIAIPTPEEVVIKVQ